MGMHTRQAEYVVRRVRGSIPNMDVHDVLLNLLNQYHSLDSWYSNVPLQNQRVYRAQILNLHATKKQN